jgi:hypothetical protein
LRPFFLTAVLACAWGVSIARAQTIVALFDVQSVVSPDGGGPHVDSTRVRYRLSTTPATVSLIVFEADSVTPVDTLRAPYQETSSTTQTRGWYGRRWDGTPAPDGAYVVTLYARGASNPDSLKSLPVFLDTTPPTVQVVSVLPNPYAPGAPSSTSAVGIVFTVANASPLFPGRVADELKSAFASFSDDAFTPFTPDSLTTTPEYTGQNGSYVLRWHGTFEDTTPPDAEYRVTLTMTDVAVFTATSSYLFEVDTRAPDVKATSLAENSSVSTIPDSLRGYAFDKRGVDSLLVRYATTQSYAPVASVSLVDDSLRFVVPLAGMLPAEGSHRVDFRAVDGFGRATDYPFNFRSDATAPPAPVLDPAPSATWNGSRYPLTGRANDGGDAGAFVRVYRNGALMDSVSTFLSDDFELDVALVPGRNDLVAVLRDGAFNLSPPSNTVTVTFDTGAGVFAPAPFGPGDAFDVSANSIATRCTVRVFDMTGVAVVSLQDGTASQFYSLKWDGINGSGVDVRKGPLVVVVALEYADGSRDVFREVFLFDPNAP